MGEPGVDVAFPEPMEMPEAVEIEAPAVEVASPMPAAEPMEMPAAVDVEVESPPVEVVRQPEVPVMAPEPMIVEVEPLRPSAAPVYEPEAEIEVPPVARPVEEPKPEIVQSEAAEAQIAGEPVLDLAGLGEVGLVEEVARLRKAYGKALLALKDFYLEQGVHHKLQWSEQELEAYTDVPKIRYLTPAELASPQLKPERRVPAADQLYTEGLHYKEYPAFPPGKRDYLKIALQKFETIIEKYPESDKIDDAAFRMGEIYGGWYFQDWVRAVQAYERCWQWNPDTEHPAYLNAAKIYDEKLKNRRKAVELYNKAITQSRDEEKQNEARQRLSALTGT
jgi:hypothetical protein